MKIITDIFGHGEHLSTFQMAARAVLVFIASLFLIRLSGKRLFGMRMPIDNVVTILLGAVLSRIVVGASPVIPTLVAGLVIVLLYRFGSKLAVYSKPFGLVVKGRETLVFMDGKFLKENMDRCMITEKDLIEGVRLNALVDSFDKVKAIYVERNGELSIIKKEEASK